MPSKKKSVASIEADTIDDLKAEVDAATADHVAAVEAADEAKAHHDRLVSGIANGTTLHTAAEVAAALDAAHHADLVAQGASAKVEATETALARGQRKAICDTLAEVWDPGAIEAAEDALAAAVATLAELHKEQAGAYAKAIAALARAGVPRQNRAAALRIDGEPVEAPGAATAEVAGERVKAAVEVALEKVRKAEYHAGAAARKRQREENARHDAEVRASRIEGVGLVRSGGAAMVGHWPY